MRRTLLFFVFIIFRGAFILAEGAPVDMAAIESQGEQALSHAPVEIDGELVFRVTGVPSYPAEKRAAEIEKRLRLAAGDPRVSTEAIKVVSQADYSTVMAGDRFLLRVFDSDSEMPGLNHAGYAEMVKSMVVKALLDYRRARAPRALLTDTALAVGMALLLFLLLLGWSRLYRRIKTLVERLLKPRVSKIQTKSFDLLQAGLLWDGFQGLMTVLYVGIIAIVVYFQLGFILRLFPWTRPLAKGLLGLVLDPLQMLGQSFLGAIPGLMVVFVIGVLTYTVLKMTGLFFAGLRSGTIVFSGFDPDWAIPTFRIVRVAIVALALMVAYPHIPGSNSMAFKGISVFLGIIISLGSSSFASNLIAGYSAIYRRAFRVGDWIEVDNMRGEVMEIQTLVTRLRSTKNEVIVIPNSAIINSPVINYSTWAKDRGLILHTTVGIGYETPWRQVEAMLLEAAARTPGLLREPKPFVLKTALGDFCVTYEINAYCSTPGLRLPLTTALHQNILDVFNEYGVQIMTPAYEGDPAQPKLVPKEHWFDPPAPRPS